MQVEFNNSYLEKVYRDLPLTGKPKYSDKVIEKFRKKVTILKNAESIPELRQFRSLNFEALKGDKKGLYSVRVDQKYRFEFFVEKNKITLNKIILIEDLSNHYR
jgi:proteic killer suppression protein